MLKVLLFILVIMCILQNNRKTKKVLEHIYNETIDIPIPLGGEEYENTPLRVNETFEEDEEELEIDVETVEVVSHDLFPNHNQFPRTICLFKIDITDTFYVWDGLYESVNRESSKFLRLYNMYATNQLNLDLCHYMITNKEFFPLSVEFLATADFFNQSSSTLTHMTDHKRDYYYVIRLQVYTGEDVDDEARITIFDKYVLYLKDWMEEDMSAERTDIKTFYIIVEYKASENVNQSFNVDFKINLH